MCKCALVCCLTKGIIYNVPAMVQSVVYCGAASTAYYIFETFRGLFFFHSFQFQLLMCEFIVLYDEWQRLKLLDERAGGWLCVFACLCANTMSE